MKPNIIFIFSDQHNASVMGNAADPYVKTPNMDWLASNGVKLDNCYCNSPLCVPSRMSILTGKLPLETGAMNNFQSLYSDTATLAHSINLAGYETVLAGRMHFCGPDQNHGYEKRFVGDVTPNYHRDETFKWIYENYGETMKQKRITLEKAGAGSSALYDFDREATAKAIDYMKNRTDERPLFMTVGLYASHPPFIADEEVFNYYFDLLPEISTPKEFKEKLHPAMQIWLKSRNIDDISPIDKKRMRAAYYALVEYLDSNLGAIIKGIEDSLGLENTIIVYASDHGESMGINDFYWKTTFFESSVKVPVIISYPKEYGVGEVIKETTCLADLTETFLEWSGGPKLPSTVGMSLIKALKKEEAIESDRSVISEIGSYPPAGDKPSAMIKKGKWKLVDFYGYDYPSLFNLEEDPLEINDLGSDQNYATVATQLKDELYRVWDPEKAYLYCNEAFENFKILKKWADTTHFEFPEVWRCKKGANYLLRDLYPDQYK
ncbi:MAG: sulfatase-like hydrolase/transferase [Eubacteriales bacterium]|nr:sulfatase-like hydrolase/transferase [Eubacteriales bacterium]